LIRQFFVKDNPAASCSWLLELNFRQTSRMHFIFFILLGSLSISAGAQTTVQVNWTNESDMSPSTTVYYHPSRPLEWPDFQGVPGASGNTAALTTSGFGYKMNMSHTGTKGYLKIQVYCYFDKTKSWVKPDKKSDYVLTHEQKHFDISYLAAEKFIRDLRKAQLTRENAGQKIQQAYEASSKWMNDMQHEYDRQTRNGISRHDQEIWVDKISVLISAIRD